MNVTTIRGEWLAVASGVLLALSFPKYGHGLVAWVALAPLLLALAGARGPGHGFRLGYLTGAVSSLGIVYWTSRVVVQYGGLTEPVGMAVMVLLCLALALFPSVFGAVVAGWTRVFGPSGLLVAPVAWVAMELLRSHTLFNFSWCLLGYSQHAFLPVIQIARLTAVYGVSFVVAATSAALAYAVLVPEPRPRRNALGAVAGLVLAVLGYGTWMLRQPEHESGRIRVGLVQASILHDEKWDPEQAWRNLDRHLALTRRAADAGARLVVWPESSLPFLFDRNPAIAAELRALAAERQIYLLFGNDDRDPEPKPHGRIWVGGKMLAPDGTLALRYHKIRLVPFGEYVPLQSVLTLGGRYSAKLVHQVGEFTAGQELAVGNVEGHPVSAFICYEAIFPDLVRGFAERGAELLVNITNDAWFGRSSAPHQHFAMVVFRAVENGKYLVRAANTGITAVVDSRGRVLERTPLFEPAVVVREVPFIRDTTFYARHGDIFAWACLGATVSLSFSTWRRRKRPDSC